MIYIYKTESLQKSNMKTLKISLVLSVFLLLTSCGLKPIPSAYNYTKTSMQNIKPDDLGEGSVLIYNGADLLHKMDNTARLNVWIDDKPLGQLGPSEYLIIDLEEGKHYFEVLHKDVVNMRSNHNVEITESTKIIKIKPNLTSNTLEVTNVMPKNFDKFRYVPQRTTQQ